MNAIKFLLPVVFYVWTVCVCACATTGAVTTASPSVNDSNRPVVTKPSVTVWLHDNCPQETAALTAELAFKVSDLNYTGSTEFSFVIPLTAAQRAELDLYLGDCARIQAALEKASEKERPLSFNTSLDGSGVELSFASEDEINASLAAIAQNKYTAVYALYH